MNELLKSKSFNAAAHYGGMLTVVGGAVLLGPPAWAVGVGAGVASIATVFSVLRERKIIKNDLVLHSADNKISPNLSKIVANLHKKSGLKTKTALIYDFRVHKELEIDNEKSFLHRFKEKRKSRVQKAANLNAQLPQAISLQAMGKPKIVISSPLLKLLNDNETKAILAHEFARVAERHKHLGLLQSFSAKTLGILSNITIKFAKLTAGTIGYVALFAERLVPRLLTGFDALRGKIRKEKKDERTLQQMDRSRRITNALSAATTITATVTLTYINPVYLGVFAAATGLSIVANLLDSAFNRSLEHQADRGSIELGARPLALITALRKIDLVKNRSLENTYNSPVPESGRLSKLWKQLNSKQPVTKDRIKRLADMAREQSACEDWVKAAVAGPLEISEDNYLSSEAVKGLLIQTPRP